MPMLQDLDADQIRQSVEGAAGRQLPVTVSVHVEGRWENLRSRLLASREDRLLLQWPDAGEDRPPHEFVPGEKIGLSFKLKHYKHLSTAIVAGGAEADLGNGTPVPALSVCWPVRMQRLQRRAFERADVPPGRIVRASFWLGGCDCEPTGAPDGVPVWSGRVANISAGGLQLLTDAEAAEAVEPGDIVGLHVVFGAGDDVVHADAQFRHADPADGQWRLGFQFLGLGQTRNGRHALQLISNRVSEFQRRSRPVQRVR